jgi:hypothetical protein
MTVKEKKVVKIVGLSLGGAIILTVIIILIVKQVQKSRDAKSVEDLGSSSPKINTGSNSSGYSSSSTSSLNGRTFSKTEIEKMQSYLFNMGAMAMNELIVSSIRDSGGIDGKIGNGFKTALSEAIRINIVNSLDDLYTQAMKH